MTFLYYVTHAQVHIDPAVPVPRWQLSEIGRGRVLAMLGQPWLGAVRRIITSPEAKAVETARIIADHLRLDIDERESSGELDRSATGFVPHDRHEQLADACFARSNESAGGWETAMAARSRIVDALADVLAGGGENVAVIGHGGVGTLLYCHLAGEAIDRRHDQPGQGHYFTVDLDRGVPLHTWRPIDQIEPG
ncbi:MAG: histidine phosphatase family protein [Acidimicrobiia bacterium]